MTTESPAASTPADPGLPDLRLATRLMFFLAGLGIACWAPLVPFARDRAGLDEASLGLMLLFLGTGSVIAMPLAGGLATRYGSRRILLSGSAGIILALPLLPLAAAPWQLAAALFLFGASLGTVDVAANIHGIETEHRAGVPLMSNFHGFYSIGGLAGSGVMTLMLTTGLCPFPATLCASVAGLACILLAAPRLLAIRPAGGTPFFVWPRGIILLIGFLTFIIFLIEGALLDWSAVLLEDHRHIPESQAGTGYFLFSLAMATGRLSGDRITSRWGGSAVLLGGALLTSAGLAWIILAPGTTLALAGFPLTGIGAANLVPVLFSAASRQKAMPRDLAISSISVMGYAGILAGPAGIGYLASCTSLPTVFGLLSLAVLILALCSRTGKGVR